MVVSDCMSWHPQWKTVGQLISHINWFCYIEFIFILSIMRQFYNSPIQGDIIGSGEKEEQSWLPYYLFIRTFTVTPNTKQIECTKPYQNITSSKDIQLYNYYNQCVHLDGILFSITTTGNKWMNSATTIQLMIYVCFYRFRWIHISVNNFCLNGSLCLVFFLCQTLFVLINVLWDSKIIYILSIDILHKKNHKKLIICFFSIYRAMETHRFCGQPVLVIWIKY